MTLSFYDAKIAFSVAASPSTMRPEGGVNVAEDIGVERTQ
jgi:hypothetical protein